MSKTSSEFRYTIISFETMSSDPAKTGVWTLVQKLATECTALIVDRPADERALLQAGDARKPGRVRDNIERDTVKLGVKISLHVLPFEDALTRLQTAHVTDVSVILQPHHPLDRQSPGFRRLSRAAYQAKGATIYFPEQAAVSGNRLLLAGQIISDDARALAQNLSKQSGLPLEIIEGISNANEMKNSLLARPSAARPALLIFDDSDEDVRPVELMKLAAVSGVAVLSYRS